MPKKQSKELRELLDKSKRQFKLATEAIERQRERELEDLEFQVEENQWTPEARKLREGGDLYPARPMLSISQLVQPLQLIANQASNSDLGVEIHAVSEKGPTTSSRRSSRGCIEGSSGTATPAWLGCGLWTVPLR